MDLTLSQVKRVRRGVVRTRMQRRRHRHRSTASKNAHALRTYCAAPSCDGLRRATTAQPRLSGPAGHSSSATGGSKEKGQDEPLAPRRRACAPCVGPRVGGLLVFSAGVRWQCLLHLEQALTTLWRNGGALSASRGTLTSLQRCTTKDPVRLWCQHRPSLCSAPAPTHTRAYNARAWGQHGETQGETQGTAEDVTIAREIHWSAPRCSPRFIRPLQLGGEEGCSGARAGRARHTAEDMHASQLGERGAAACACAGREPRAHPWHARAARTALPH